MKITINTTEAQDDALTIARDAAHVGKGSEQPPTVEEFAIALIAEHLEAQVAQVKQSSREDLKRLIDSADDSKLAAAAQALR